MLYPFTRSPFPVDVPYNKVIVRHPRIRREERPEREQMEPVAILDEAKPVPFELICDAENEPDR